MAFPSSPTNGQLAVQNGITYTYNSTYSSWTRNPSTLPALSIIVDTFTGNGSTVAFTLSVIPSNADFISINIAGVSQLKSAYTLSSNIVTFTSAPANGAVIEVKSWNSAAVGVLTGLTFDSFTGNGSAVAYTLSTTPTNKNYTLVTIGGITQEKINYSVSGTTLTFTTAPPNTAPIEVTTFGPAINTAVTADTLRITTVAYPGSATAANPAGGETITVTGSGFNVGIIAYINNTTACATTYISSTSLTFIAPATSAGTYNIVLYNTDGSSGVKPIGIIFSSLPSWVTASGALTGGTQNSAYSISISATGDSIVYSITTGSLPTGLSLNSSTGAITGTPTVIATSTFSITATDAQNQAVARSFSIAVTSVIPVEFKLWAGGGGGTAADGFGGGSGGFVAGTLSLNPGTVLKVVVGAGGSAGLSGKAGGGGGYCGVFLTSVSHANALLIAGAGSSGARGGSPGVGGGGLTGQTGNGDGGGGGTQSAGGAGGGTTTVGTAGSALQGGKGALGSSGGSNSGGAVYGGGPDGGGDNATATPGSGGAGYYGGGGAGVTGPAPNYGGSGGGGSSYLGTATSTTNTVGNNGSGATGGAAINSGDAQYQANTNKGGNGNATAGGNGACVYRVNGGSWIVLSYTGADQTITIPS